MYFLHLTYATGTVQTIPFHSAFVRGLAIIMLADQVGVTLSTTDGAA